MKATEGDIMTQQEPSRTNRLFDSRINFGVVLTLAGAIICGIWNASAANARIDQNTIAIAKHDVLIDSMKNDLITIKTSVAILQDRSRDANDVLHRIDTNVSNTRTTVHK